MMSDALDLSHRALAAHRSHSQRLVAPPPKVSKAQLVAESQSFTFH